MGLAASTVAKLRDESSSVGGKVYDDGEDALEDDITHSEEDDNPLTLVGDLDDDETAPVGETEDED